MFPVGWRPVRDDSGEADVVAHFGDCDDEEFAEFGV